MGRIVNHVSMTVDGLTDVSDWFVAEGGHDAAGVADLAASAAFLTGRTCYEGFLGFWPSASGPWAEALNPMPKYVASRTLTGDLEWNARAVGPDAVAEIRRLKDELDGDLFLSGCGELARDLLAAGLVDGVTFWVHPAVRGGGNRPYEGAAVDLELLDVTGFDSGVVRQRYRPVRSVTGPSA